METKKITGVLVDTRTNKVVPYLFTYEEDENGNNNFLPTMYGLLGCDIIEVATRYIGNHLCDIICDEEGLFKEHNTTSIATFNEEELVEQIVGSVFICNHDEEGNFVSLKQEEINSILENTYLVDIGGKGRKIVKANVKYER